MSSSVYDIIVEKIGGLPIATQDDIEALRSLAYDRCHEDAQAANIYFHDAIENLARFAELEDGEFGA